MASVTKICKVCGQPYKYCNTQVPGAFRWQDVACCREHAQEYFRLIEDSRKPKIDDERPPVMKPVFSPKSVDGGDEGAEGEPAKATPKKRARSEAKSDGE